ncbi:hypothetical protein [Aestuariibaculum marinum]|uniref:Uncharacterized protein n=1 Tax=Aestuariibaculum marinum TaxID=2683592 RepID=A0A8J6PNY8_9FLAO|nr:hypothetical protein [Aestuariibaculum marinum]MBD0822664.1 hypothetical protein [Aestuariibaculum marinum]
MRQLIIIFALIFAFMQTGCGSKKKASNRHRTKSVEYEQKDIQAKTENYKIDTVSINTSEHKIIITPVDNSKPITVNGKTYDNAKIEIENKQHQEQQKSIDSSKTSYVDNTKSTKETKTAKRSSDSFSIRQSPWFWLAVVLVVCFAIYFSRRWYKSS